MKLTIFGATGATGKCLVTGALAAGHEVTAAVRDPGRMTIPPSARLHVVTANVMDPAAIGPVVAGADAVLSALGPHGTGPTTVSQDSVRGIIQAMDKTGVRRLVTISGAIVTDDGLGFFMRYLVFPLVRIRLRNVCADMRAAEREVRASQLDWTIIRPPTLTNKPARGSYRIAIDRNLAYGSTLSRADLATCMLKVLGDPSTVHHAISTAY
jgi:putative NADH-flavin reductase